jgi:hypothetical protein
MSAQALKVLVNSNSNRFTIDQAVLWLDSTVSCSRFSQVNSLQSFSKGFHQRVNNYKRTLYLNTKTSNFSFYLHFCFILFWNKYSKTFLATVPVIFVFIVHKAFLLQALNEQWSSSFKGRFHCHRLSHYQQNILLINWLQPGCSEDKTTCINSISPLFHQYRSSSKSILKMVHRSQLRLWSANVSGSSVCYY